MSASGDVTIDTFQDKNEIPISESIDKFSMQVVLVITVYFLTYLLSWGLTSLVTAYLPGLSTTILPLLWGFNFVLGSLVAILTRTLLTSMKKLNYMKRQYQNNYLLNRISGLAFDIMIVCGIASINIEDLSGLWIPFLILAVLGGIATLGYLIYVCKKIYPGYYFEGMLSMYGMMTGTISSGVLLLREVDPNFKTPAANNLVIGSSYAILFGAPILALVGMAPKYDGLTFLTLGLLIVYLVLLLLFLLRFKKVEQHPSSK